MKIEINRELFKAFVVIWACETLLLGSLAIFDYTLISNTFF